MVYVQNKYVDTSSQLDQGLADMVLAVYVGAGTTSR